jgi:UBX domain-containing protein 1
VVQICAVSDDAVAKQYLDSANGSLEDAINTYMAAVGDGSAPAAPAASAPASRPAGGLAGMASVLSQDPDEDGRQEYYAGGASSGAAILDPSKKQEQDIFKRLQAAAEAQGPGGDDMEEDTGAQAQAQAQAQGHNWGGGGYSLGGEGKESAPTGGGVAGGTSTAAAAPAKKVSRIVITRYSDGFTLDEGDGEGDVRRPDDPKNAMFLQDLERGQVPMELRERVHSGNLDVALSDKQGEPAPKPKFKAFTGSAGQTLGGASAEEAKAAIAAAAAAGAASATSWEGAKESLPTTKLQIRLHDGQR